MENKQNKKFIIGIVGLAIAVSAFCICMIPYVGMILAIVGLVLSIIGIGASRLKGFGIGGTIVSAFALLFSLLFTFVFTSLFVKAVSSRDVEKKAETVYNTSKQFLAEVSVMGESTYDGVTISTDGGATYFITVSDLVKLGELDKNPFKSNNTDGGMTVYYKTETNSFTCDVTGTIDGYTIEYWGLGVFYAHK